MNLIIDIESSEIELIIYFLEFMKNRKDNLLNYKAATLNYNTILINLKKIQDFRST